MSSVVLPKTRKQRRFRLPVRWLVLAFCVLPFGALILHRLGAYLIVDDALEPAQAIIVLAGGYPTREWEAADVFRAGFAPRVILVPEWFEASSPTHGADDTRPGLADRQALLIRQGVPASAISVATSTGCMTADELQTAAGMLADRQQPVILVTSKYHARRVSVVWQQLAGAGPRGLLRTASGDPFSPKSWWRDHRFVIRVAREYLGLLTAALPLPAMTGSCQERLRVVTPLVNWLLR
jgi:uncharacterized SAM-binding protein YcdF (DUF218 family)